MITTKDIQNLASLARLEISADEAESLTGEIDSILSYVAQIKDVTSDESIDMPHETSNLYNVMREDVVTNTERQYTENILKNAPNRDGDYLKVKKIL